MNFFKDQLVSHHKTAANEPRIIKVNGGHVHEHFKGNYTSTTKYNPVTYLPKALFEQFRSVHNSRLPLKGPTAEQQSAFECFVADRLFLPCRRVANTYFGIVAGLSCLSISPVA